MIVFDKTNPEMNGNGETMHVIVYLADSFL